jgi:hypothetical protein
VPPDGGEGPASLASPASAETSLVDAASLAAPPAASPAASGPASVTTLTQMLDATSHAGIPAVHAVAFVAVHCTHSFEVRLHAGVAPEQSASVRHCAHLSAFGPDEAQIIVRHTVTPVPASPAVQLPSPLAYPHLPSVSQTPLVQARAPFTALHVPLTGAAVGRGCPFGVLGVQTPA